MPANLSPEYLDAERDYRDAQTPAERIAALERMLSTIPKHKGTEKLQADLKRRLAQARKQSHKKGGTHAAPFWLVEKEGAGQVALVGPPNSGKSQLVCALTHARPQVGNYPFTTRVPTPGMMPYEDIQIQLVDLPPLAREFMEPWLRQAIRTADATVLLVDPSDPDLLDEIEFIRGTLEEWRVPLPRLLVANKMDLEAARDNLAAVEELYCGQYRCLGTSATSGQNLDGFARALFDLLELVRVYTKAPGKKADLTAPYVVRRGQTVLEVAGLVHRDFADHFRFARLYHAGGERDGMMVEREHVVADGDVLEFHT